MDQIKDEQEMRIQLDLLTYQPTPEEMAEPPPQRQPVNQGALDWWNTKQLFYLKTMRVFMDSNHPHKTTEITRLDALRQHALERIEEIRKDARLQPQ